MKTRCKYQFTTKQYELMNQSLSFKKGKRSFVLRVIPTDNHYYLQLWDFGLKYEIEFVFPCANAKYVMKDRLSDIKGNMNMQTYNDIDNYIETVFDEMEK